MLSSSEPILLLHRPLLTDECREGGKGEAHSVFYLPCICTHAEFRYIVHLRVAWISIQAPYRINTDSLPVVEGLSETPALDLLRMHYRR